MPGNKILAKSWQLLIALICLLGGMGCSASQMSSERDSQTVDASTAEDLPIVWQKSGTYSRIGRTIHLVARDRQTLARLPIAEVPVDFEREMVLVVGLGPTPTNELGVRITRVWREGSRIRVQERRIHPGVEHTPGFEPASPWTIAVVPRSDFNVEGFVTRVPAGTLREHPGAR